MALFLGGSSPIFGPNELRLESRARRHIKNEMIKERAPQALAASAILFRTRHPNAELRSSTATYNCVGLVLAARRTAVMPDELIRVLTEDDYQPLNDGEAPQQGDVVVYEREGQVEHTGIVWRVTVSAENGTREIVILSKWGQDGEYIHEVGDVPSVLGRPTQYWTDRK
jgi:hypothetical protein